MIPDVIEYLANNLAMLTLGLTCALGIGALFTVVTREPHQRQRMAEMSLVATLGWLIAIHSGWLSVPPRWQLSLFDSITLPLDDNAATTSEPTSSDRVLIEAHEHSQAVDSTSSDAVDRTTSTMRETLNRSHDSIMSHSKYASTVASWSYRRMSYVLAFTGILGSIALMSWLMLGRTVLWIWLSRSQAPPTWLAELYSQIGPVRRAKLRLCRRVRQPCSYGVFRPVILLPIGLCDPSRQSELRHVLLHEQAHVDRRDAWGHFLCDVCLPLLYWHPCYWWLRRQITICHELLADDAAVKKSSLKLYVKDLTALARHWKREPFSTLGAMGMKNRQNDFCVRMEKLLSRKQTLQHSTSVRWRLVTLLFLTTMVWFGAAVTPSGVQADGENSEQNSGPTYDAATDQPSTDPSGGDTIPLKPASEVSQALSAPDSTVPSSRPSQPVGFRGVTEFRGTMLSASISGRVLRVLKSPGDSVKSLEVVAEVDAQELQQGLARAQFDLELAAAQEVVAESELDGVKSELETAKQFAVNARQLSGRVSPTEVAQYSAAVTQKTAAVRTAEAQLQAAQVKVKLAKLNVDAAQQLIKSSQIVSSVDGRVGEVLIRPGEYAAAGSPIMTIDATHTAYVKVHVPFPAFHPTQLHGKTAVVEIPLSGNRRVKVAGKIEATSTSVSADGQFQITVAVNNLSDERPQQLMAGVEATVFVADDIDTAPTGVLEQGDSSAEFVEKTADASENINVDREIAVLKDKIAQLSTLAKRIDALHHKGAVGGEAQHHAAVFYQLRHAEAQLAGLQGDTIAQLEFLADAVTQAKRRHEALAVSIEAGTTTLDQLLDATEALAAIQLEQQRVTAQLKSDRSPNPTVPTPATE